MKKIVVLGLAILLAIVFIIGCAERTPPAKTTTEPTTVKTTPAPEPVKPVISPTTEPKKETPKEVTVYLTRTGKKYHRIGCRHLSQSCIPIELKDAKSRGFEPCKVCNPPE